MIYNHLALAGIMCKMRGVVMNHQLCPSACDFWQSILRALALGTHCKHLHVFYDCVVMVFLWLIAHSNIVTSAILAVKTCLQYMLSTCTHILCT